MTSVTGVDFVRSGAGGAGSSAGASSATAVFATGCCCGAGAGADEVLRPNNASLCNQARVTAPPKVSAPMAHSTSVEVRRDTGGVRKLTAGCGAAGAWIGVWQRGHGPVIPAKVRSTDNFTPQDGQAKVSCGGEVFSMREEDRMENQVRAWVNAPSDFLPRRRPGGTVPPGGTS